MDKKSALENLGFKYEFGKYKKLLCEQDGATYTLACELGKAGFQVEKKTGDTEDTSGAGKYMGTNLETPIRKIADQLDYLMKNDEKFTVYEEVKEAKYEPVGDQKDIILPRPGRRIKSLIPEMVEVGTIRAGEKYENENGKILPRATEYFRITTKAKNDLGYELDQEIHDIVGQKPTKLNVRLPCDRADLNFVSFFGRYKASKCECRGDGYTAETFDGDIIRCLGKDCEYFINDKCKQHGTLSVILEDAPRCGVIWKFRTTSEEAISNLDAAVTTLTNNARGHVAQLPMSLILKPKEKTIQKGPQRGTKKTFYLAHLEYRGGYKQLKEQVAQILEDPYYMESVKSMERLMEATIDESPEDQKDIQETFHPEV